MHHTAGAHGPFSTFVNDLLESDVADFRLVRVQRDVRPQGLPPKIRIPKGRHAGRLRKINSEVAGQIIALRSSLTQQQLAVRFGVAASTIRRTLDAHEME